MSVDPRKERVVLVVHGVQLGDDEDQSQLVTDLINLRIGNIPLKFRSELYKYENINSRAQKKYDKLLALIISNPIGYKLASSAMDIVGDVVSVLLETSTAATIRKGLRKKILEIYENGHPCYVLAHSLGSIYAFDVINQLMKERDIFDRSSRKTWPVQGLMTFGSPIGLDMFAKGRKKVTSLGTGTKWFRWENYWDQSDPIVSGSIFGQIEPAYEIARRYIKDEPKQGWVIRDHRVDTGKVWLAAHTAYWEHGMFGDKIVDMITS